MADTIKIVTKLNWASFRNVATNVRKQLSQEHRCSVHDWKSMKPGGRILAIGTANGGTLRLIKKLLPRSDVVFYATTEGVSRIDNSALRTAKSVTVVAVSEFVKKMIEKVQIHVAGVVYHGLDMSEHEFDERLYGKMKAKFRQRKVILTVSANHFRKGLDRLLEAYKIVHARVPDSFLVLHCERDGYHDLKAQARELGINDVLWLTNRFGRFEERQLNALYKLCDLYVQPNYSEGFGLPILEALRFNKPVVAVDAPLFNKIIKSGETGALFPSENALWANGLGSVDFKLYSYDPSRLAGSIVELLLDPKLLAQLRKRIVADKWNWDAKRLYPQLLSYFN